MSGAVMDNDRLLEHYIDNAATTEPSRAALDAAASALGEWGNPSSVHSRGQRAAVLLGDSRAAVGKTLGMARFSQDKLVFTSSGTEANNIALLGCAHSKKRDAAHPGTIIISAGEHPSIDLTAARLEAEGYDLIRVPTAGGVLDLDYLAEAVSSVKSPVVAAAFMLVNNETGAVYDVKSAARIVKAKHGDALIHCDAVQGYMKLRFTPSSLGVDTLTVSAHKIHSIRGAGALYVSSDVIKRRNISPAEFGGGQEGGLRSGTENLVSISAFAAAATDAAEHFTENRATVEGLRAYLDASLAERCPRITANKPAGECLPDICSVAVPGVRSETMLNYLSGRRVYVSAGSACSASSKKKSAALDAFGVSADTADSTIRISISHTNTRDDIDALIDGLSDGSAHLQKKR